MQLHEGQLWTIPWGTVCQQKQLLTDVVAGGSFPPLCSRLATNLTGISPSILLIHPRRRGTKQAQAQYRGLHETAGKCETFT